MKKRYFSTILLTILSANFMYGINLDDIKKEIKELNLDNKEVFLKNIVSIAGGLSDSDVNLFNFKKINGSDAIMAELKNKNTYIPVFITNDGAILSGISDVFLIAKNAQEDVRDFVKNTLKKNSEAFNQVNNENLELLSITNKIPKEYRIDLDSDIDTKKLTIVLSDPECPYCRDHIQNDIPNLLKESNVRIFFTPVHGDSAFVKSAIALRDASAVKTKSEKIKVLNTIFSSGYSIPEKDKNIDIENIKIYGNLIIKSGNISGVPYEAKVYIDK